MFRATKRFLRMSLSTWFLIFSISCLVAFLFARFIRPSQLEANAIRGLEDLGIKVTFHYEHEFGTHDPSSWPPGPAWVRAIFGEMVLARICYVNLEGEITTLDGCNDLLNQLTHLNSLRVHSSVLENVDALRHLEELAEINLHCASNSLKNIDVLSSMNLYNVLISDCNGLTNLDSIGKIKSLDRLLVQDCNGIKELNMTDWEAANLKYFYIAECNRLTTVSGVPETSKICCLELFNCQDLEKITLLQKSNLDQFFVDHCDKLNSIGVLPASLTDLRIHYCDSLRKITGHITPKLSCVDIRGIHPTVSLDVSLESVESFCLWDCDGIRELDFSQAIPKLKSVYIHSCKRLVSIHSLPESLEQLDLSFCESLERVTPTDNLPHLKEFHLTDCPKLSEAPVMPLREVEEKKTDSVQP